MYYVYYVQRVREGESKREGYERAHLTKIYNKFIQ